jgi:hypothetical protein
MKAQANKRMQLTKRISFKGWPALASQRRAILIESRFAADMERPLVKPRQAGRCRCRFSQSVRCRQPPRRSKTTDEAGRFDDESC